MEQMNLKLKYNVGSRVWNYNDNEWIGRCGIPQNNDMS